MTRSGHDQVDMASKPDSKSDQRIADDELRRRLQQLGLSPGPVTDTTREALQRKLRRHTAAESVKTGEATDSSSNGGQSSVGCKDVFISYSREPDSNKFVQKLKKNLELKGYSVWMDTEDIRIGSDWHSAIGTALQECQAMVAVLTDKYITSQYCKNELFMASQEKKHIFPVFFKEVDLSSSDAAGIKYAISSLNRISFKDTKYVTAFSKLLEGFQHQGVKPSNRQQ